MTRLLQKFYKMSLFKVACGCLLVMIYYMSNEANHHILNGNIYLNITVYSNFTSFRMLFYLIISMN